MELNFAFTVKHQGPDGIIMLWPARKVVAKDSCVDFYHTDNDFVLTSLTDGEVFVMNQNGKTIDRFWLGGEGLPKAD